MKIALDVDGVLADVIVSWLNYSNSIRPNISKNQVTDWEFWKKFDIDPNQSILIEDIAHNLEQAKNLGMKTCWLENEETFAKKDSDKPYIDYKIKNLPSFLQEINILKSN